MRQERQRQETAKVARAAEARQQAEAEAAQAEDARQKAEAEAARRSEGERRAREVAKAERPGREQRQEPGAIAVLRGHQELVASGGFSPTASASSQRLGTRRRGSGTPRAASRSASR